MVNGRIHIRDTLNDQRVVAPHFQGQNFFRLATQLLMQLVPHRRTAGEEKAIN